MRAVFADLSDFEVVLLTDGDGTYPASEARRLIEPLRRGGSRHGRRRAASRRPGAGAMTLTRGLGNKLIPRGLLAPDRPRDHRPPFGLPRVQSAASHLSGPASLGEGSRSRDRAGQRGSRPETEGRGGSRPLPIHGSRVRRGRLRALRGGRRILVKITNQSSKLRPLIACCWRGFVAVCCARSELSLGVRRDGRIPGLIVLWESCPLRDPGPAS